MLLDARAEAARADRAGFRPLDLALRTGHSNSNVVALLTREAQAHAERTAGSPVYTAAAADDDDEDDDEDDDDDDDEDDTEDDAAQPELLSLVRLLGGGI